MATPQLRPRQRQRNIRRDLMVLAQLAGIIYLYVSSISGGKGVRPVHRPKKDCQDEEGQRVKEYIVPKGRPMIFDKYGYDLPGLLIEEDWMHPVAICREKHAEFVNSTLLHKSANWLKRTRYDYYFNAEKLWQEAESREYIIPPFPTEPSVQASDIVAATTQAIVSGKNVTLSNLADMVLDFKGANLKSLSPVTDSVPFRLHLKNSNNVVIRNLVVFYESRPRMQGYTQSESFLLVSGCSNIRISRSFMENIPQAGIAISSSSHVYIEHNRIVLTGGPGILLHGNTQLSRVLNNTVLRPVGADSLQSGIVLSYRRAILESEGVFGLAHPSLYYSKRYTIIHRVVYPTGNLIKGNTVINAVSGGIYLDGVVGNLIYMNEVVTSSRQGISVHAGATGNILYGNIVTGAGKRDLPNSILEGEVPEMSKRMPDGTTIFKLPGISLDNAVYNIIWRNTVQENQGGGIKLVRTSFYNVILDNVVVSNNMGGSGDIRYPGISVMSDSRDDPMSRDREFTPGFGNIIAHNIIYGPHAIGILFADGCSCNQAFYNDIQAAVHYGVEITGNALNLSNFVSDMSMRNKNVPFIKPPLLWWPRGSPPKQHY